MRRGEPARLFRLFRPFRIRRTCVVLFAIVCAATSVPAVAAEPEIDAATGLRKTGDWELVRANCTVCHSARMVTQQRASAAQWRTAIRWMQATQNLWKFDPATEKRILAYLAENYPPSAGRRRAAIAAELMPPNPYGAVIRAPKE